VNVSRKVRLKIHWAFNTNIQGIWTAERKSERAKHRANKSQQRTNAANESSGIEQNIYLEERCSPDEGISRL
jgi:hypothetical protein